MHDTIHGSIDVAGPVLELLDTPELQRLAGIRQTGLASLVFPGANHIRLEHVLGASHVATRMAIALGLTDQERELVTVATLLHDLGHGPYSHTIEYVLHKATGFNHMELTQRMITGEYDVIPKDDARGLEGRVRLHEILTNYGIDPKLVARLITGEMLEEQKTTLDQFAHGGRPPPKDLPVRLAVAQIVHSPLDADQVDYLQRDAHYTGVAYGVIDMDRLMQTIRLHDGAGVIERGGLSAIEGMIVARGLMYTSVYFHKTVRIAEVMLSRAAESLPPSVLPGIHQLTDGELFHLLLGTEGLPRELALRLKYRRLYKKAIAFSREDLTTAEIHQLRTLADHEARKEAERRLCEMAGAPVGSIFIDSPTNELLIAEPRIHQIDIGILDEKTKEVRPLYQVSSLARALSQRELADWLVMVCARDDVREAAARVARRAIFG